MDAWDDGYTDDVWHTWCMTWWMAAGLSTRLSASYTGFRLGIFQRTGWQNNMCLGQLNALSYFSTSELFVISHGLFNGQAMYLLSPEMFAWGLLVENTHVLFSRRMPASIVILSDVYQHPLLFYQTYPSIYCHSIRRMPASIIVWMEIYADIHCYSIRCMPASIAILSDVCQHPLLF